MKFIIVDCGLGISGDMLAAALFDLGVSNCIFENNLLNLKVNKNFNLNFKETMSEGIKGIVCEKGEIEDKTTRSFKDIKTIILDSDLNDFIKTKAIRVFQILVEAESNVHGLDFADVHLHELGSMDSIVDIVNVCSAIDFLGPEKIFFSSPPTGSGIISSSHGLLPVPVPTVLEIAKNYDIPLVAFDDKYIGEITTPTGIALIAAFANKTKKPLDLNIKKIGVGVGQKKFHRPNFLRVILTDSTDDYKVNEISNNLINETIVSQEAWIDDSSPEDISLLIDRLRKAGAIDVACHSIDMKKNRKGICIKVIVSSDNQSRLREVWFNYSTTLGLREQEINRWIIPRQTLKCKTSLGEISLKKAMRPNGQISVKIEHNDLKRISSKNGIPIDKIRQKLFMELSELYEIEDYFI
tara:strand:+ start:1148 stop:2377 length:1230 start_codon:yes stop_codon:yes gene_type:complete